MKGIIVKALIIGIACAPTTVMSVGDYYTVNSNELAQVVQIEDEAIMQEDLMIAVETN